MKHKKEKKIVRLFFGRTYRVPICLRFYLTFHFTKKLPQVFLLGYYNTYYALQVLCTIGKLKEIPNDFPLETEEITISNQDIRTIPANGTHSYSN